MNATRAFVAIVFALSAGSIALAADAPPGAASCSGCHAANPRVQTPVPPLMGRPAADIAKEMIAFKSGERKGTIMDRIAKGFSDDEIQAIATWYAAQKQEARDDQKREP
jgi:sulfide dehydrogenase cytochrome subunit